MSRLVPKLRFKEFSGEWEEKILEDKSDIVRGGSPRPIDDYMTIDDDALNWLKIADVDKNSKYVTYTKERVKKSALSKTREVYIGDLILSNSMSFGRPYIMKIKSCIHDGWIAVTNIKDNISSDYLYYMILSPISQKFFIDYAAGGGIRNLNADIIKSLPISLPKLEKEQQKIANCLSSLDSLIEAQNKKVEALKKHKKGLMQQLFPSEGETVPKLRFDGFSGEWEEKELERIGDIITGNTPKTNESENYGNDILFVSPADISEDRYIYETNKKLSYKGFTKTRPIKAKSILVVCIGSTIGKVAQTKLECATNQQINSIVPFDEYNNDFIYSTLEKDAKKIKGMAGNHAVPIINKTEFSSIKILVPQTKLEQEKIANILSSLDALIKEVNKKVEALKEHKKGLMQQLFVSSKG